MPERFQDYKRSLFLNALASVLLALIAAALRGALWHPSPEQLHRFLPLGAVCYGAVVALGLVAWRQLLLSAPARPWTRAPLASVTWSVVNVGLGIIGAVGVIWGIRSGL